VKALPRNQRKSVLAAWKPPPDKGNRRRLDVFMGVATSGELHAQGSAYEAAEHHENAAKSHRTAAEHHGKGHEESTKAQRHAKTAREHSEAAHGKSQSHK
jgi:hypothetical protein